MSLDRIINKVINSSEGENETLLDLTEDTVNENNLLENQTAHNREGEPIRGALQVGGAVNSVNGKTGDVVLTTSDLANNSGFITITVNNLINYYLKSETYSKSEVDSIAAAIKNSRFEFVAELPTTDIQTNVIYLVPKTTAETSDIKDEYINLDGTSAGWEKIGDTDIDLSGYVTTQDLNTALADYTTTANLTLLLADKVDKVTGKGLSTEDFTTAEKTKLDNLANIKSVGTGLSLDGSTGELTATGGTDGHTIVDEQGNTYPARAKLKFINCDITDDSTNDTTIIEAEGGSTDKYLFITSDAVLSGYTATVKNASNVTVDEVVLDSNGAGIATVTEAGNYTVSVTYNGSTYSASVSVSVDPTYNVDIELCFDITVTMYGAVGETISYTDFWGAKTQVMDSGGSKSNVTISVDVNSPSITFTGNIAKNPSNLSQSFSKTITLTKETITVSVMPVDYTKMLYWYGYQNNIEQPVTWTGLSVGGSVTFNTNYVYCSAPEGKASGIQSVNAANMSELHGIFTNEVGEGGLGMVIATTKNWNNIVASLPSVTETTMVHKYISFTSGNYYSVLMISSGRTMPIYAMWYV